MNKLFFLLIFMLSFSSFAKAEWDPYVMTKEKFVHLTPEQQKEVVIKTMEFFVAMESAVPKDYEVLKLDRIQNEKVVQLFLKLQDFILSSAYAQDNKSLLQLADRFNGLIQKLGSKACIYAGYVSEMASLADGTEYCPHPLNVKTSSAAEIKKAYLDQGAGKNSCSLKANKVSCNPVVFGYKSGTTPFCVTTSMLKEGKPQNVAYNCMRASLSTGDVDARLAEVSEAMKQSASTVTEVHKTLFKMCVCGNQGDIHPEYQKYMRGHRTCLGLMNTLKNVNESVVCAEITEKNEDIKSIENFSDFFTRDMTSFSDQANKKHVEYDDKYSSLISSISNLESIKKACDLPVTPKDDPVDPTPADKEKPNYCKVEVKASEEDPTKYTITLSFEAPEGQKVTPEWPEGLTPSEDKLSLVVEQKDEAQTITIPYAVGEKASSEFVACSAEVPGKDKKDDDSKKEYKIDAKSQTPGAKTVKVIATVTLNGEVITDITKEKLTIVWHYLNFPATATTPPPVKKTDTKIKDTTPVEGEETGPKDKDKNRQDKVGSGPEVEAPRSTATYKACAELIQEGKVIADDCDDVAPVSIRPQMPMNQQQPNMAPPRFINNTRNIGF